MAIELQGKPICITGASSGIGLATALECARAGMPVVLAARRVAPMEEAVQAIRSRGGKSFALACDVTDPEACRRVIEATVNEFGSIYSAFANAGYGVEKPVHEMSDGEVRDIFEVNFFGSLNIIRPALEPMLAAGRGHIVLCSSCLSKFTLPYFGAYCATKAAQNHVARAMRLEVASRGVHVSSVHPIGTKTEFFGTSQRLGGSGEIPAHTPPMFMQTPERVARAVVRCLRRPRPEVWTSLPVRMGMALCTAFPRLADLAVGRMVRDHEKAERPAV